MYDLEIKKREKKRLMKYGYVSMTKVELYQW